MSLPPGPKLPRLLQTYLAFTKTNRLGTFCEKRYGPTFRVNLIPWGSTVVVTEPDVVKEVFTGDPGTWRGGVNYDLLGALVGDRSVLLLEEPDHLDARKKLLPHFNGKVVQERYAQMVADITLDAIARWPTGKPFDLQPTMATITLEVILRAIVGARDPDRIAAMHRVALDAIELKPIGFLGWLYRPLARVPPWRRYAEAVERAREMFREEVRQREADLARGETGDGILDHLVRAKAFDEEEMIDQLMSLLVAGHESTSTVLAWTFERLVRHPEVLARAREDDEYLTAAIKETMRVRPVTPVLPRRLSRSTEVAGYQLPAGTTVMVATRLIHLSPDLFNEPERFRPERFLDGERHAYDWLPFGGGHKRCLGASFALFEIKTVVRTVLNNVELRPDRPQDEEARFNHIVFGPARGTRVVMSPAPAAPGFS